MNKKEIRQYFKQKRLELTDLDIIEKSISISDQFISNFQLSGKTVSLYVPIERNKEINTYLILEKLVQIKSTIALPKTNMDDLSLTHYRFNSVDQLVVNSYGIPEPTFGEIIQEDQFNIVLIPLLAIDKSGNRVGYGKGFYDRFLEKCSHSCLFIGLHLFDEIVEIDDLDSNDIPLDFCITPTKIIQFDKK